MIQKIREKLNIQTVIRVVPAALFLLFIFFVMIFTSTGKVKKAVTDTKLSIKSIEELSDSFEETLQDNIYDKNNYIVLNGFVTKILGINSLNEVQKLTNGQLIAPGSGIDITETSSNVIALNEFLNERRINFVYILVPIKRAFYNAPYAPGYSSTSKRSFDNMVEKLKDAGVVTIDMNSWFEDNDWNMDDVYYKTDNHWNTEACMTTVNLTMELMSDLGIAEFSPSTLDEKNWTVYIYDKWYLGSYGKRVGSKYTGVDDFTLYIPNFETDFKYSFLNRDTTSWTYKDTLLNMNHLENKDYFNDTPYTVYVGGNHPVNIISNSKATNKKRVLLMGDSFDIPFTYFLSTQFHEVYTIDLRYYTDGTLVEYIEEIKPDIVIMCSNSVGSELLYYFGTSEYLECVEETNTDSALYKLGDFKVQSDESNENKFTVVCSNLKAGQAYTLTLDSTIYDGGEDLYVQMTLQDLSSNTAIYNRYFDANSNETQKWIFITPEDIGDEYSIYLYAGTKGHTANVSVNLSNVVLREGIFED